MSVVEGFEAYGVLLVLLSVTVAQLGAPIPSWPVLIVAGALAARGGLSLPAVMVAGIVGCLIADAVWYAAGMRWGRAVLRQVCRFTPSPDGCARTTESSFARWGVRSLLVARFVPGFGAVATVMAGRVRVPIARFVAFDGPGAAAWVAVPVLGGALFSEAVIDVLDRAIALGRVGVLAALAIVVAWVLVRRWQWRRLLRELEIARIDVDELAPLMASGHPPVVLDVRTEANRRDEGMIPGAIPVSMDGALSRIAGVSQLAPVVVYCDCPDEVSAALVARRLIRAGYRQVRPLRGGMRAWADAGHPVMPAGPPRQSIVDNPVDIAVDRSSATRGGDASPTRPVGRAK